MKPRLLEYLVCPSCRTALRLEGERVSEGEIAEGDLVCVSAACGNRYPIIDFIPRLLPGVRTRADLTANYAASFGFQWNSFQWERAEDREEFFQITDLTPDDLRNKVIVAVGCGGGRFMKYLGEYASDLIGFDYSVAVDKARELAGKWPSTHFVQGDAHHPPLRDGTCDFLYSHGVLHHTPDTSKGFRALVPLVRDGGDLYLAVFRRAIWPLRAVDASLRAVVNRLPFAGINAFCSALCVLGAIPGVRRLHRFVWFSRQKSWEVRRCCNFDWYAPRYHHEHSIAEVKGWFESMGFRSVRYINGWPLARGDFKYRETLTWAELAWHAGLVGVLGRGKVKVDAQRPAGTCPAAETVGAATAARARTPEAQSR
jgi:SAM-dependent methyltransferase